MKIARILRFLKDENQQKVKRQEHKIMRTLTLNDGDIRDIDYDDEDFTIEDDVLDAEFNDSNNDLSRNSSMKNHQNRHERNSQISIGSVGDQSSNLDVAREQMYRQQHSSKIGMSVADTITRDVVFGILLTVSLTPIFNSAVEETYSAMYLAIEWFDFYVTNTTTMNLQDYVDVFLAENNEIRRLMINGTYYLNEASIINGLRESEMMTFNGDYTTMILDISAETQIGHAMNIGFTLVIVCLFAGLAFLITSSIGKLVVHPIERMTRIIQEFTKKVCFLGGDMDDQATIVSNLLETQVIEAAIGTLSNIFDAITGGIQSATTSLTDTPKKDNGKMEIESNNNPKKTSFMNSLPKNEGVTYIKSRDSVIAINIKETKRVFISEEEIQKKIQELDDSADIDSFCVSVERFPELKDVQSAMQHPIASEYFRSFCAAHMAGENYSFVRSVSKYHEALKKEFMTVYSEFLAENAEEQIPIDSRKRKHLLKLYADQKFCVNSFDEFRMDVIQSLQSQIFHSFSKSKWASAYVLSMDNVKDRYKHLNLHKYDKHQPESPNVASPKGINAIQEEDEEQDEEN